MTTIGFLHTSDAHVPVFRGLLAELAPGTADLHVVDPTLLADARAHGPSEELAGRVHGRLGELAAAGADLVVCTCSSIGALAERHTGVPVVRGDRPMAERAVAAGRRIAVVFTSASTLEPTRELLHDAAGGTAVTVLPVPCPQAWPAFEAGDLDGYARQVADAARRAAADADVVVLAQASMTPAAALLADLPVPVLTSPRAAVERAVTAGR